jgi:hypothetical protein
LEVEGIREFSVCSSITTIFVLLEILTLSVAKKTVFIKKKIPKYLVETVKKFAISTPDIKELPPLEAAKSPSPVVF